VFRAGHEHKGTLAAIAIRRVVVAMQRYLAAGGDGGQCGPGASPVGSTTLDAGETDFAAVFEAQAARIDHGGNTAFTLRLKQAIAGAGRSDARQYEK
jgi:hypothetical protein